MRTLDCGLGVPTFLGRQDEYDERGGRGRGGHRCKNGDGCEVWTFYVAHTCVEYTHSSATCEGWTSTKCDRARRRSKGEKGKDGRFSTSLLMREKWRSDGRAKK